MDDQIARVQSLKSRLDTAFDKLGTALQDGTPATTQLSILSDINKYANQLAIATVSPGVMNITIAMRPFQLTAIHIAQQLNLFELVDDHTPIETLVSQTQADPCFLSRIIRSLATLGHFKTEDDGTYSATPLSRNAASPTTKAFLQNLVERNQTLHPKFLSFLDKTGYKTHRSQDRHWLKPEFGMGFFEWIECDPRRKRDFDVAMGFAKDMPSPDLPLSDFQSNPKRVLMVDVGSGTGQAMLSTRSKFPYVFGKIIIQDLPQTFEKLSLEQRHSLEEADIQIMPHDFFTDQPIHGAKYYYFRHVFHDWEDRDCSRILKCLKPALGKDSRVLIHDRVLPDSDATEIDIGMDLCMMVYVGGVERSEGQWDELLRSNGFEIERILTPCVGSMGIIEAKLVEEECRD